MQPESAKSLPIPVLGHSDGGPATAEPPYHVRAVDFIFVLMEFDPDAARRSLPSSLVLKPDEPGFIGLYSANSGWGITPYTGFFMAVPVRGHASPDGSCGYFPVEGFFSGRAGRVLHENYNSRYVPGFSRQWNDGKTWFGEAGPGETPIVNVRLAPVLPLPTTPLNAGVHHYLGERSDGGLNIWSVAYSGEFPPAGDIEIKFNAAASPLLKSLQPKSIPFASIIPSLPLTFSPPRPVSVTAAEMAIESARMSFLDVLGRLGRAAALVTTEGRVAFVNGECEALLAGAVRNGRLRVLRADQQREFDRIVTGAVNTRPSKLAGPIALEMRDAVKPVLAQAIPVSTTLAGEPANLILFADPTGSGSTDPTAAFELLGLTRAEARIATAIGNGKTAREAAEILSISDNTVRATLKVVYDKLDIGKQSELGQIVARLDGFGTPQNRAPDHHGITEETFQTA